MRLNHGNIVPVYTRVEDQIRYSSACQSQEWGIPWIKDSLPKFQWPTSHVPVPPLGIAEATMVEVLTGTETDISRTISYHGDGTSGYYTFPEGVITLGGEGDIPCGFIYLKIVIPGDATYYTEVIHLQTIDGTTGKYFRLRFKDTSDKDAILYTQSYEQVVLFEATKDFQTTQANRELFVNGLDEQEVDFSSRKVRDTLIVTNFPSYWEDTFQSLTEHDYIKLEDVRTGEIIDLSETEFATEQQNDCFLIGRLSYVASHMVDTACDVTDNITQTESYSAGL